MSEYDVVWSGDIHRAPYYGCLACPPAPLPSLIEAGPECARERAKAGHGQGRTRWRPASPNHEGVVARLAGVLSEQPMTIRDIAERVGWSAKTVYFAVYWHRKTYPGQLRVRLAARTATTIGRSPNEYWVEP